MGEFDDLLNNDNFGELRDEFSIEDSKDSGKSSEDDMLNFDDDFKLFMNDDKDGDSYQEDINKMLDDDFDVNEILDGLKENKNSDLENIELDSIDDIEDLINNLDKKPEK